MGPAVERTRLGVTAVYRHPLPVRIAHWVNALCLLVLLLSGLQILNAHPAFYWGETARFAQPLAAVESPVGENGEPRGRLSVGRLAFDTTGFLGASGTGEGGLQARAFPEWMTLPSYPDLGGGRRWHFAFAWILVLNGLAYGLYVKASGRMRGLLWPSATDLRGFGRAVGSHLRLRFAHGDGGYNVLQKLAYLTVILGLLPLMLATGLAMSPAIDARLPLLVELLGGRQSARTLHFAAATGLVGFVALHLVMVAAAGPVNEVRSMITGWFVIGREKS